VQQLIYTCSKFWQSGGLWWNIKGILYMLPEEEEEVVQGLVIGLLLSYPSMETFHPRSPKL
jgi:hypothetical protein